jgi:uncharacterized protein (TIGR02284 family)
MATRVGTERDVWELLPDLVELDVDAVEAYGAAIKRLQDTESRSALTGFMQDHERHVREVGLKLKLIGGEPPIGPDIRGVLEQGRVVIAGLMGDRAILMAMKANEDDTNAAYERAAEREDLAPDLRAVERADLAPELRELLLRNLGDERRHRAWIERRLSAMSAEQAGEKPATRHV